MSGLCFRFQFILQQTWSKGSYTTIQSRRNSTKPEFQPRDLYKWITSNNKEANHSAGRQATTLEPVGSRSTTLSQYPSAPCSWRRLQGPARWMEAVERRNE
ncbi:uncharacterized protein LOC120356533 [Nilaparvata lugens]|uniref:uncharacterized protein LOC120356533 n=1 Tax=Nilaparvata lugens TaxID=108931 RepID=UPI00193CAD85|nr:uncharacterized protein LOC120356533 [Nilaparvata lugens]